MNIPKDWKLTPVKGKAAYLTNWVRDPLPLPEIQKLINSDNDVTGMGVLLGEISNGLVAVDIDGSTALAHLKTLGELPKTVTSTSGKHDRSCFFYQISQELWECVTHNSIKTGQNEALELRWNGHQQVLPPSIHPDTKKPYKWIVSPDDCDVAIAPDWLIQAMAKIEPEPVRQWESNLSNHDEIPLEICISPKHRALIDTGNGKGGRDNGGAALIRDLLGTASYLQAIGQRFYGDPYDLLAKYCTNCDPPLTQSDLSRIYKSAQSKNHRPCLDAHKIETNIRIWQSKQNPTNANKTIKQNPSGVLRMLNNVESSSTIPNPDAVMDRGSNVEMLNFSRDLLNEVLAIKAETLDLSQVLPNWLANPLFNKALSLPCPVEFLLQPFLSICAGLIGRSASVDLGNKWIMPSILWTGIIGDPGGMKTPAINAIFDPLNKMQAIAHAEYLAKTEEYANQLKLYEAGTKEEKARASEPPKPIMRDFYHDDFTMEGLLEKHSYDVNKNGFTVICDELAGLFAGLDQYKSGTKGNSRQILLKLKSGGGIKRTLKGEGSIFIEKTAVSITGGIQPKTLQKLMQNDDDADGMWGRFLWVNPPFIKPYRSNKQADISSFLLGIYKLLDKHPETLYTLSPEADKSFDVFVNWIAENMLFHAGGLRNFMSKVKGDVGTIAMVLHILDRIQDESLNQVITHSAMTRAIALGMYYFRQVKAMYSQNSQVDDVPPELLKIIELSGQIGKITPRILQQKKWAKDSTSAVKMLENLVELGFGAITLTSRGVPEWENDKNFKNEKKVQHSTFSTETHTVSSLANVESSSTFIQHSTFRKNWI